MAESMRGFSLLENLIALAILTLGLFGAAALQSSMARAQRDASQYAVAANLAGELADLLTHYPAASQWLDVESDAAPDCYNAACAADAMAAFSVARWRRQAEDSLPDVHAKLTDACCSGARQLMLTWPSANDPGAQRKLALPIRPIDSPA